MDDKVKWEHDPARALDALKREDSIGMAGVTIGPPRKERYLVEVDITKITTYDIKGPTGFCNTMVDLTVIQHVEGKLEVISKLTGQEAAEVYEKLTKNKIIR